MSGSRTDGNAVLPPAGWYEDPTCRSVVRYWDGRSWSPDQVRAAPAEVAVLAPGNASVESWSPVSTQPAGEATETPIGGGSRAYGDFGYRIIEPPPTLRQPWHRQT